MPVKHLGVWRPIDALGEFRAEWCLDRPASKGERERYIHTMIVKRLQTRSTQGLLLLLLAGFRLSQSRGSRTMVFVFDNAMDAVDIYGHGGDDSDNDDDNGEELSVYC